MTFCLPFSFSDSMFCWDVPFAGKLWRSVGELLQSARSLLELRRLCLLHVRHNVDSKYNNCVVYAINEQGPLAGMGCAFLQNYYYSACLQQSMKGSSTTVILSGQYAHVFPNTTFDSLGKGLKSLRHFIKLWSGQTTLISYWFQYTETPWHMPCTCMYHYWFQYTVFSIGTMK